MAVYQSLSELTGRTPLLNVQRLAQRKQLPATVLVKLEAGILTPGAAIIEPTSGNTGIALAAMGIARGYRVILTMPDSMSVERRALLAAYGAELVLTPGSEGMAGAIRKAQELAQSIPGGWIAGQFDNPSNPKAHYRTTGPEIWDDTQGQVDIFVAGVGTGGTLSGVGRYLKEHKPEVRIVAVEPADSPLLSGGKAGPHGLQGIGANFVPENLDRSIMDEVITVTTQEAYDAARLLVKTEGVLCGISSGAALHAAMVLAQRPENRGKTIVALLTDTGERYLSTPLFAE